VEVCEAVGTGGPGVDGQKGRRLHPRRGLAHVLGSYTGLGGTVFVAALELGLPIPVLTPDHEHSRADRAPDALSLGGGHVGLEAWNMGD